MLVEIAPTCVRLGLLQQSGLGLREKPARAGESGLVPRRLSRVEQGVDRAVRMAAMEEVAADSRRVTARVDSKQGGGAVLVMPL